MQIYFGPLWPCSINVHGHCRPISRTVWSQQSNITLRRQRSGNTILLCSRRITHLRSVVVVRRLVVVVPAPDVRSRQRRCAGCCTSCQRRSSCRRSCRCRADGSRFAARARQQLAVVVVLFEGPGYQARN